MLSQTTEYALRLVVQLAAQHDRPVTIPELARTTRIPEDYLAKVLRQLARAGLVRSQRGPNGGSTLARAPEEVSVLDVVQAVDPLKRIEVCPLGLRSHGANLCPLHRRLDQAIASVEAAFRQSSLAEILEDPRGSRPLCEERGRRAGGGRS
ncbi:MAG TPA: Rrf2 family transcriptional regulator [Myxococcaceae bacterium]|nr:Rrf2 family transcriptional regulator [Myxococcaceae bacterium]